MKKLYILFVLSLTTFFSYSQDINYCGWEYTVTANNATIAIQQENFSNINLAGPGYATSIQNIECPMWIGVFYQPIDGSDLECAGYTPWTNDQNMAITAWGDDSTTPELDGMSDGDPYVFGLCIEGYEEFFVGMPSMSSSGMFTELYSVNAFGSLEGVAFGISDCVSCIIEDCWPINIDEEHKSKKLLMTVDIFGRIINESDPKGLYFEIFDNNSINKSFTF